MRELWLDLNLDSEFDGGGYTNDKIYLTNNVYHTHMALLSSYVTETLHAVGVDIFVFVGVRVC